MRRSRVLVGKLAMFVCRLCVVLGLFVLSEVMVVRGLVMVHEAEDGARSVIHFAASMKAPEVRIKRRGARTACAAAAPTTL